jgi:uncharacterized protein (DUF1778 family)
MTSSRSERIDLRVTPEFKKLVSEAAAIASMSISEYMISKIHNSTIEDLKNVKRALLTLEDRAAILQILNTAPETPNKQLAALLKKYEETFGKTEHPPLGLTPRRR